MEPYESIFMQYGITPLPADTVEAMAYVPFQPNSVDVYNPVQAFETGTMFPTLDNLCVCNSRLANIYGHPPKRRKNLSKNQKIQRDSSSFKSRIRKHLRSFN